MTHTACNFRRDFFQLIFHIHRTENPLLKMIGIQLFNEIGSIFRNVSAKGVFDTYVYIIFY